ncbi:MarR family transcriptional regulator [Isoptericola sp. NPDC055881]
MNGVDLFLLGRALMKIGQDALPEPPGGEAGHAGSARVTLIVAADVAEHASTTVGEIASRTGLPQSQVSTAVARLKVAGAVRTASDPADRRRTRVVREPGASARLDEIRSTTIVPALARHLGTGEEDAARVATLLDEVGATLLRGRPV